MNTALFRDSLFSEASTENINEYLAKILSVIRKHLKMDVAFIAEFKNGNRVFKFVDSTSHSSCIAVNDADPLEQSYCKKIVDKDLPNVIPNTLKNPITKNMAVTQALSIGSYMGVPICLSNGVTYGTFCCFKHQADNSLNDRDLSFMSAIADIAREVIEGDIELKLFSLEKQKRIQQAIENNIIQVHYQPIYSLLTNQVAGFESLSRFDSASYISPDKWFNDAAQVGLGEMLEMLAVKNALSKICDFSQQSYISINTSPEYILNGAIVKVLEGIDLSRVVLEVTEHSPISDYAKFTQVLAPLRARGIRLAIDDAGAGYASFQHIIELEAEIIKLDISLTQNIQSDQRRYLLAKALCAYAKSIDCTIIAEGIETLEQLATLRELGVDKVQGYLLGRPSPLSDALNHESIRLN
ncbi:sensor domain-containing phosphodiesterase [Paraglaciecola aestuariivivens]